MKLVTGFALFIAFASPIALHAGEAEAQIEGVLNAQVDAWNRGDIPAFVNAYAVDCIFVGKQIAHGRAQLLARYQRDYPTREAMGQLTFKALEIHLLTADVATITGEWHLQRSDQAGKAIGGLFSLVFQRQAKEWKIALDHTS